MSPNENAPQLAGHDAPTLSSAEAASVATAAPENIAPAWIRHHGIESPNLAMHEQKARELYALSSSCMQCSKPIASLDEATAVYFDGYKIWKLVHKRDCAFASVFATNPLMGVKVRARR